MERPSEREESPEKKPAFGSGSFVPPPQDPREKSSLEELEKRLYRKNQNTGFEAYRSKLSRKPLNVAHLPFSPRDAGRKIAEAAAEREPFLSPVLVKILWSAIFIFSAVAAYFGYVYFGGGSLGSSEAVSITIGGPVSVAGGSPVSFEITLENSGAEIVQSDIIVTFPPGTRSAQNPTEALPRHLETVGPLLKGERESKVVRAIFFGAENSEKEISVEYSFQNAGSNALYQKTKTYTVRLTGSPLGITTTLPKTSVSGVPLAFDLKLTSNATLGLDNVLVSAAYPPGFSFSKSTPEPALGTSLWSVGTLNPGEVRIVHIEGMLEGEDAEPKLFRLEAGTGAAGTLAISAPYGTLIEEVTIERPPLAVATFVGGSASADPSIEDASDARVLITLSNTTTGVLKDVSLLLRLSGELVERADVAASKGYYQSVDGTVRWDKSTYSALANLAPGEAVDLDLVIGTKSANRPSGIVVNPKIVLEGEAKALRTVSGAGETEVTSVLAKTIKISTLPSFTTRALYSTGPFKNSGPYPPKAEKETTYTVTWTVANTSNALARALVRAKLPAYISWLGVSAPQSEKIAWNENSREVVWQIGDVAAKTGYAGAPRSVSFQVRFIPSLGQAGTVPVLVESQQFEATDSFTNVRITGIKNALTTELITDPVFTGEGRVAP